MKILSEKRGRGVAALASAIIVGCSGQPGVLTHYVSSSLVFSEPKPRGLQPTHGFCDGHSQALCPCAR